MSTERDRTNKDRLREQMSALADGELTGESLSACLAASARDDSLLSHWADYQRVGDVLRGGASLAGRGDELAFVAVFRQRLAAEALAAVPGAESAKVLPFPLQSVQPQSAAVLAAAPAGRGTRETSGRERAANDGVYRWKMVASLATVMAVLVVGWVALDDSSLAPAVQKVAQQAVQAVAQPAATPAGGTVVAVSVPGAGAGAAAQTQTQTQTQTASAVALLPSGALRRVSQPGLVVEKEPVGSMASRYALQAANDDMDTVMIRDPRLDEFLAAHRQGSAAVLQAPIDLVRDAAEQAAP